MLELIDTHCHLADERLRGEVEPILERAAAAGVCQIVSVGAIGSIETDRATVEIARSQPAVYAAVGVHPHDASDCDERRVEQLRELACSDKVVAIGETGMDLHYLRSPRQAQEMALRRQLRLAGELNLPVVIHCRQAEAEIARIVREEGMPAAGGVIHCFSSDRANAERFLEMGFYLSISGIVTFKSAHALRQAMTVIPEERLLVETDAPYLTPEPHRGRPNEPAYVPLTLATVAACRASESVTLAAITSANARRLFRLPQR
ncbi:MAG TPA: TatD family hydrolase [Candidatus Binataceae bacterium]|nr:TatD family hydrolase [Candidatus Binataceae bacterium]